MLVGLFTNDVELYARLYAGLTKASLEVRWKKEGERILGDLEHLFAQILVWPTPWGVRAYDPVAMAFLTRQDRISTLAEGLRGRFGLRLSQGERRLLLDWVRGKQPSRENRFFLRGLRNKFSLADADLLRIGRVSAERLGLLWEAQGFPVPGREAQSPLARGL